MDKKNKVSKAPKPMTKHTHNTRRPEDAGLYLPPHLLEKARTEKLAKTKTIQEDVVDIVIENTKEEPVASDTSERIQAPTFESEHSSEEKFEPEKNKRRKKTI